MFCCAGTGAVGAAAARLRWEEKPVAKTMVMSMTIAPGEVTSKAYPMDL